VITGEEEPDKVGPPVSSEEKEKKRKREEEGCGLARLGWATGRYLGPGLAQVAEASLFFCSENLFKFLFSSILYNFCIH
jgi:hypothetical protein